MTILKEYLQLLLLLLLYIESYNTSKENKKDNSHLKLEHAIHLNKKFNISWKIETSSKTIKINLDHNGKGYVGIGFSETGSMTDADMFIGGVNKQGKPYYGDYHSIGYVTPVLDKQQDWKPLESSQINGKTHLVISRLINTGDKNDVQINDKKKLFIVWAFGDDDEIAYHDVNRGSKSVRFKIPEA